MSMHALTNRREFKSNYGIGKSVYTLDELQDIANEAGDKAIYVKSGRLSSSNGILCWKRKKDYDAVRDKIKNSFYHALYNSSMTRSEADDTANEILNTAISGNGNGKKYSGDILSKCIHSARNHISQNNSDNASRLLILGDQVTIDNIDNITPSDIFKIQRIAIDNIIKTHNQGRDASKANPVKLHCVDTRGDYEVTIKPEFYLNLNEKRLLSYLDVKDVSIIKNKSNLNLNKVRRKLDVEVCCISDTNHTGSVANFEALG